MSETKADDANYSYTYNWFLNGSVYDFSTPVTDDMNLVSGICDELMVLNFGTMLAHGSVSEVLSDPEVVKAYLGE